MNAVRSALFNVVFFGWSAIVLLTLWLALPLPRRMFRRVVTLWPRVVYSALRHIVGARVEVRGQERIPDRAVVYAAKHQSAWDTMFFLWLDPDTAYVMKSELRHIPFWGWYMRRGRHIMVERTGGAGAMRDMIREANLLLAADRSVVIFPEGTRSAPGEIGTYHPGIAALYTQSGATVVPVALNSGCIWPRRSFIKRPGRLIVEFLEPMPAGLERKAFMAELEARIEGATRRLEAEAHAAAG